jgi:hypothetical protein
MACQKPEKSKNLKYYIIIGGLDKKEHSAERGEKICLASIFSGTSIG